MTRNLNQRQQVYKTLLNFVIIMFFTNSCSNIKYTTAWPKQPRQESYSLSKEAGAQTGSIDTSVIYVRGQDWILNGDFGSRKKYQYDFMKFGSNGIAYYSNYSDYQFTESSVLSIGGQYCYYKVINNELQIEFYDHLAKHFKVWYAEIYSDKIIFYKEKLRVLAGAKDKLNFIFNKSQVKYIQPLVWPE